MAFFKNKKSQTHIYLLPYVKYAYGHEIAEMFHEVRPDDSRLLLESEELPISVDNIKGMICFFNPDTTTIDDLLHFELHPAFLEFNNEYDYPGVVFNLEDKHALKHFLAGEYSKMYPTFMRTHREYFFNQFMGITSISLAYEVCTRNSNRLVIIANMLGIEEKDRKDIKELDSKPDLGKEIINKNNDKQCLEISLNASTPSLATSLLNGLNQFLQQNTSATEPLLE